MKLKMNSSIRSLLKKALQEDIGSGDVTTRTLIPENQRGEAWITAKESGVLSGGPVAREVFRLRDRSLRVRLLRPDGFRIRKGERLLKISGRISSILEAERVALNFLGHLSGIATLTRRYVERVRGTRARVLDTRKTIPLWRELEKYAVRCGRGENHRFGLWDEVMVKENHWDALEISTSLRGDPPVFGGATKQSQSLRLLRPRLGCRLAMTEKRGQKIPVEMEVRNLHELAHLLEGPYVPDRILLDNFSVRDLRRAVLFVDGLNHVLKTRYGIRRKRPYLEASGRISLRSVRAVALTGVDRISVGRLTHSAPALDFSLKIVNARGKGISE